jgi:hypothetical protein
MRISNAGNVGIGTASPSYKVDIVGGNIWRGTSGSTSAALYISGGQPYLGTTTNHAFAFITNDTERARLDSSGNLGIGTSSPGAKLEAYRNSSGEVARFTAAADGLRSLKFISSDNTGSGAVWTRDIDSAFAQHRWAKSGTPLMVLDESGNLGLGVTPSTSWFASSKAIQIGSAGAPYMGLVQQTTTTCDGYMLWGARLSGDRAFQYVTTGDAPAAYRQNAGSHAWFSAASGTAGNTVSFTQAMTLTSGNNLGLGTTSPTNTAGFSRQLQISGTTAALTLTSSTGGSNYSLGAGSAGDFGLWNNTTSSYRWYVDSSGNVGIGTSSPLYHVMILRRTGSTITQPLLNLQSQTSGSVDGDSFILYGTQSANWSAGVDQADSNKFRIEPSTTLGGADGLTITTAGNLGIGTTSPSYKLVVSNSGAEGFEFVPGFTTGLSLLQTYKRSTSAYDSLRFDSADYRFTTGGTERMRLTAGGTLVLNGTAARAGSEFLTVYQTAGTTVGYFGTTAQGLYISNDSTTPRLVRLSSSGDFGGGFIFTNGNTDVGTFNLNLEFIVGGTTDQGAYNLQCNGTGVWGAGAYVNGSDARLKDNIQSLDSGLDVVNAMRPVTFQYKQNYSKDQSVQPGFIAQELQEAMAGKAYLDGVVQEGTNHLNVAYQNIIPILVKAMQEQQAMINELMAKVAALESK